MISTRGRVLFTRGLFKKNSKKFFIFLYDYHIFLIYCINKIFQKFLMISISGTPIFTNNPFSKKIPKNFFLYFFLWLHKIYELGVKLLSHLYICQTVIFFYSNPRWGTPFFKITPFSKNFPKKIAYFLYGL